MDKTSEEYHRVKKTKIHPSKMLCRTDWDTYTMEQHHIYAALEFLLLHWCLYEIGVSQWAVRHFIFTWCERDGTKMQACLFWNLLNPRCTVFSPLPIFGPMLGPLCFHTSNQPHKGSLRTQQGPGFQVDQCSNELSHQPTHSGLYQKRYRGFIKRLSATGSIVRLVLWGDFC